MPGVSFSRFVCATLVVVGGLSVSSKAEEVLLDFGSSSSYRGLSVSPNPDARGNYWNSVVPGPFYGPSATPLVTTTGASTTIGEGFTTSVGTDSYNGPSDGPTGPTASLPTQAASFTLSPSLGDLDNNDAAFDYAAGADVGDGVGANSLASQFTLSGLNTAETYTLIFYGSHVYDTQYTTYAAYGNATYTTLLGSATLAVETTDPNSTPGNTYPDPNLSQVATITGLSPVPDGPGSATGSLYIEFYGDTDGTAPYDSDSGNGYLNSMEILGTSVPEPASLSLVALGGSLLMSRRRRA